MVTGREVGGPFGPNADANQRASDMGIADYTKTEICVDGVLYSG